VAAVQLVLRGEPDVTPAQPSPVHIGARWRVALLAAVLLGLSVAALVAGLPPPTWLASSVAGGGVWASVAAIAGIALLCAVLVPRSLLTIAAGAAFGAAAIGYVIIGATAGALAAYAVGRLLGRDYLAAMGTGGAASGRVGRSLATADAWVSRRGVLGVMLARILPGVPFGLISYAYGVTAVGWRQFAAGTLLGVAPSTVVYVSLGAAAGGWFGPMTFWLAAAAVSAGLLAMAARYRAHLGAWPVRAVRRRVRPRATPAQVHAAASQPIEDRSGTEPSG